MKSGSQWKLDDYRGPQGARPVKAFLDGLSAPAKAKVYAALEMLATEGNQLGSFTAFGQDGESRCFTVS